jgi:hypothetical protein
MEDIQEPVKKIRRYQLMSGSPSRMRYIAELIEMAYLAGLNKVNIREGIRDIKDTGEARTLARNFVRDKGFPI